MRPTSARERLGRLPARGGAVPNRPIGSAWVGSGFGRTHGLNVASVLALARHRERPMVLSGIGPCLMEICAQESLSPASYDALHDTRVPEEGMARSVRFASALSSPWSIGVSGSIDSDQLAPLVLPATLHR